MKIRSAIDEVELASPSYQINVWENSYKLEFGDGPSYFDLEPYTSAGCDVLCNKLKRDRHPVSYLLV